MNILSGCVKILLLSVFVPFIFITGSSATEIEFSASLAFVNPIDRALPELTSGYGYGFSLGLLPVKTAGISLGVITSRHRFLGGTRNANVIVHSDSEVDILYFQGHYNFMEFRGINLEACLSATYNSINGGDSTGGYIDIPVNYEEVGYSGWGIAPGLNIKKPIQSGYYFFIGLKYNLLTYTTHNAYYLLQNNYILMEFTEDSHHRKGNSWIVNMGICYRINFTKF